MEDLVNKFESFNMNEYESQNMITEFITEMDNDYQSEILLKLFCGYSGSMYLENYEECSDCIKIHILGARNNNGREKYTITIKNKRFSCTCKDFTYRSKKNDIVCKHITFIVCKVAHILDHHFFKTKQLSDVQLNIIQGILNNNNVWNNRTVSVKGLNNEFITQERKYEPEEACPICFEWFQNQDVVSCPQCKNYIHKTCMDIWLERNNNCVYCRSYDWRKYVPDISKI